MERQSTRPRAERQESEGKRREEEGTALPEEVPTEDLDPATETLWSLFEERAQEAPERTAILEGETEIDYEALRTRAREVAGELVARGVEPGARVGVCLGRSWEMVATLLGVLGAGCAYVPLDPAYPRRRLRSMLEGARAAAVIVDSAEAADLCGGAAQPIRLEDIRESTTDGIVGPEAADLAYVLFTSGSTGRPKGVAVEHRSVVAMSRAMGALLGEEELTGVLASASISFDASVMEILGTLILGGTVVLAENVLQVLELPKARWVRTLTTVPTALGPLLSDGRLPEGLRCVVLGGEVLQAALVERLWELRPGVRILNVYGPTETTVFATVKEVAAGEDRISIGKPVPGTRAYILDEEGQPVAADAVGELYLAGAQLARGYLHDEALTQERFLPVDPGGPIPEERLYRTGDACRWREDGEIDFLGRLDQQVKVRGFRVELEEIEAILQSMPGVEAAAATVLDGVGGPTLAAYLVSPNETVSDAAAQAYLAERLPDYSMPEVVIRLEGLPRLPNGKLDRAGLPRPKDHQVPQQRLGRLPAVDSEADEGWASRLAGLPREEQRALVLPLVRREIASLLQLPDPEGILPDGSLVELGIDSLNAVELSSRLSAILGHRLSATAALEHLTPAALVEHIADEMGETPEAGRKPGRAPDTLATFQAQIQSCYPPFLAAKAPAWSADDKATFVSELRRLVSGAGQDPHSKVVRTGSAHRGRVADAHTRQERETVIWTTNLYLGLNRDPEIIAAARSALDRFGTGMGTSAVAGGVTDLHLEFENAFAELVGKPAACLFPTGFTANLGVIAGLLGEGDVVVMDQLCHASIVDGARLSGATIRTFQHNDPADLEAVLESEVSPYRTVLVVLEGVYSMGEGAAPVAEIAAVAKRKGALVLVDEAHSFGFYGPRGAGLCAARGATEQVDFVMTTLSKAMGSLGGVIAARQEHIDLLKSSARAYIFQASTSPAAIAAALAALRRLREDDALRERLWATTAYMRRRFTEAGYDLGTGDGPVITPHFPDKDQLFAIVNGLFERGVLASAVTYPVVEKGRSRLRFICSASHTREDVDKTLEALLAAERDAEGQSGVSQGIAEALPQTAALAAWVDELSSYLQDGMAAAPGATPNLTLSVGTVGDQQTITLRLPEGEVTVGEPESPDLDHCTLRFATQREASFLVSRDIQGLLDSVLQGTCTLSGRVQPFVWLIGRLAQWEAAPSAPPRREVAVSVSGSVAG